MILEHFDGPLATLPRTTSSLPAVTEVVFLATTSRRRLELASGASLELRRTTTATAARRTADDDTASAWPNEGQREIDELMGQTQ